MLKFITALLWLLSFESVYAQKISDLPELSAGPASDDMFLILDVSDLTLAATGRAKKITPGNVTLGLSAATGAAQGGGDRAGGLVPIRSEG